MMILLDETLSCIITIRQVRAGTKTLFYLYFTLNIQIIKSSDVFLNVFVVENLQIYQTSSRKRYTFTLINL